MRTPNKPTRSLLLVALVLAAGGACGNRLLVGQDPDGGAPTGAAGTTGASTGVAGGLGGSATGAADASADQLGTTGVAGGPGGVSTGAAGSGTATRTVTPLRISGAEAVRRLAAVIWKDLPSDELTSQAQLGVFTTTEDLHGAVRQLLADPRARAGVGAFYRWWLDLDHLANDVTKDSNLFPQFTRALAQDMARETETFGVNVTLDPNGTYKTLMTAPYSYLDQPLAALYGVGGVVGDDLRLTQLDAQQRAGLLTQPAVQALGSSATRNSPSKKGTYLSDRIFCRQVPVPPVNTPGVPADGLPPGTTLRQWLAASAASEASCTACHAMLDPPGLALETFDALGRWRTTDNGAPVDVSNLRIIQVDPAHTISGPIQLANLVASSGVSQECMARKMLQYALDRALTSADEPSVAQAVAVFTSAGLNLKELIFGVLTTDAFLAP